MLKRTEETDNHWGGGQGDGWVTCSEEPRGGWLAGLWNLKGETVTQQEPD